MSPPPAPDPAMLERLLAACFPGATLASATPLHGGVSARITLVDLVNVLGCRERIVVRQHGDRTRVHHDDIALREHAVLRALAEHAFPAPCPIFIDPTGNIVGLPVLVVSYIEGVPDLLVRSAQDGLAQIAAMLARLHRIDPSSIDVPLPHVRDALNGQIFESTGAGTGSAIENIVRNARIEAWPKVNHRPDVLLHGDFWPGNLLWNGTSLVGVVDWEDAMIGDPWFDLAAFRLEVFWTHDAAAMDTFTRAYLEAAGAVSDREALAFWDLTAALDPILHLDTWGHPMETVAMMREKLVDFVNQALAVLREHEHA